ncbi:hypothetical protein DM02DRAFT_608739 [Periconia macrospinosa]|uniref:tRNA (adenine(58)-N(1))-methyltransferase non-catalytic subunit TRM6 n=1 Tax=Periconia macrospinosa TaxID=97972 RepID=A0A2V1ED94_9PLEO|nr:hypothetical protein DM02DRAFT_608739 [Periconia macrospinosa]
MHSIIRPNTHVALRLPSGLLKIVEIIPNTNINLGKYGTFPTNKILGRPYYLTFEILDSEKEKYKSAVQLRVVPASELHAEALGSDQALQSTVEDEGTSNELDANGTEGFDIVDEEGDVIMRNNRLTVDDPSRQTLSMEEIEELKKAGAGSGKDIIAKIMASHLAIDEKTSFSLAKYTLRKSRKYLKRFTALPLDIGTLTEYVAEKEAYKILELREESLGLICSWANVHCAAESRVQTAEDGVSQIGGGRWLVVDDTGGLVTAAMAEKMGILYPTTEEEEEEVDYLIKVHPEDEDIAPVISKAAQEDSGITGEAPKSNDAEDAATAEPETTKGSSNNDKTAEQTSKTPNGTHEAPRPTRKPHQHIPQMSAQTNTITILHPNNQPNVSHLKYFGFDTGAPAVSHPLYTHLKSVSWLQLLHPMEDPSYIEPETISDDVLATMKSSKRGNYYKKRRRWEKTKRVVDETRAGGFDGLVVASSMETKTILKELVPLVRGGGKVVVYSPNPEPLVELCDYYSKDRRAAYIAREFGSRSNGKKARIGAEDDGIDESEEEDDFPVNPTLLLAPSLQTARARHWQVLPQRTHPFMTSKGGAEGYLFTATRVLPIEGKVEARGHGRSKKRKVADS